MNFDNASLTKEDNTVQTTNIDYSNLTEITVKSQTELDAIPVDFKGHITYTLGSKSVADGLSTDPREDCGKGIHMAHLGWCLDYGRNFKDLAILEVEAKISEIILPIGRPGKVRAKEVKVVREVPLSECGVYGKILEKRLHK